MSKLDNVLQRFQDSGESEAILVADFVHDLLSDDENSPGLIAASMDNICESAKILKKALGKGKTLGGMRCAPGQEAGTRRVQAEAESVMARSKSQWEAESSTATPKSEWVDASDPVALARFMAQARPTHPLLAKQRAAKPSDADLPTYTMDDSIPTCPLCGSRTDFTEPAPGVQIHKCLNCGYRFRVETTRAWRRRVHSLPVRSAVKKCPPGKKRVGGVCKRKKSR